MASSSFIIRKLKSRKELLKCLEISFDNHSQNELDLPEFPISKVAANYHILTLYNNCAYFRLIEKDGIIVGWLCSSISRYVPYSDVSALAMDYYQCSLKGFSGAKALLLAHDDFFEFADSLKLECAVSSSRMYNKEVFNKILEKDSWLNRNGLMVKCTRYHRKFNNNIKKRLSLKELGH